MTLEVLLVENDPRQYDSLSNELQLSDCRVQRSIYKQETITKLRSLHDQGVHLDVAAIDLGLPPDADRLTVGLDLIEEIRNLETYQELPILAYTSQTNIEFYVYANAVRRLLTMQASMIYLRPLETGSFANLLKYVSLGFSFLSPAPAGYLKYAVPNHPDPLSDEIWQTLDALSRGLTHTNAAKELNISPETIRSRLDSARQILIERNEIMLDADKEEVVDWARNNQVRYVRDKHLEKTPPKTNKIYR